MNELCPPPRPNPSHHNGRYLWTLLDTFMYTFKTHTNISCTFACTIKTFERKYCTLLYNVRGRTSFTGQKKGLILIKSSAHFIDRKIYKIHIFSNYIFIYYAIPYKKCIHKLSGWEIVERNNIAIHLIPQKKKINYWLKLTWLF